MATSTEDQQMLMASLDNLLKIRSGYALMDMRSASPETIKQYNYELNYIGLAITNVNHRILSGLTDEMSEKLPEFKSATERVATDLKSLRSTSEILSAVSSSMSTITSMVNLFKSS